MLTNLKSFLLIILSLLSFNSFGQHSKTYFNFLFQPCEENEASFYQEKIVTDSGIVVKDYYINSTNLQMLGKYMDEELSKENGFFTFYYPNGNIAELGKYINGKREGLWNIYYMNGSHKETHTYKNGNDIGTSLAWHRNGLLKDSIVYGTKEIFQKSWFDNSIPSSEGHLNPITKNRSGKWIYYFRNGQKSAEVVYNANGNILKSNYFDENGNDVTSTGIDLRPATIVGGHEAWLKYLIADYPKGVTKKPGEKITVSVSFTINEKGEIENPEVLSPYSEAFDNIALDLIKNCPKWEPSYSNNRPFETQLYVPITFK